MTVAPIFSRYKDLLDVEFAEVPGAVPFLKADGITFQTAAYMRLSAPPDASSGANFYGGYSGNAIASGAQGCFQWGGDEFGSAVGGDASNQIYATFPARAFCIFQIGYHNQNDSGWPCGQIGAHITFNRQSLSNEHRYGVLADGSRYAFAGPRLAANHAMQFGWYLHAADADHTIAIGQNHFIGAPTGGVTFNTTNDFSAAAILGGFLHLATQSYSATVGGLRCINTGYSSYIAGGDYVNVYANQCFASGTRVALFTGAGSIGFGNDNLLHSSFIGNVATVAVGSSTGTYALSLAGAATSALNYNAAANTVQAAIIATNSALLTGKVAVTDSTGSTTGTSYPLRIALPSICLIDTGGATSGTFAIADTLGNTATGLAYNIAANTLQAAIAGLSSLFTGKVTVVDATGATSGTTQPFYVAIDNDVLGVYLTGTSSLTGGTGLRVQMQRLYGNGFGMTGTTFALQFQHLWTIDFGSAAVGYPGGGTFYAGFGRNQNDAGQVYKPEWTTALAYNVSPAALQTALALLRPLSASGAVTVQGVAGQYYHVAVDPTVFQHNNPLYGLTFHGGHLKFMPIRLTLPGSATFTLSDDQGNTSSAIAFNASNATIQAAIEASLKDTLGVSLSGKVTVSGTSPRSIALDASTGVVRLTASNATVAADGQATLYVGSRNASNTFGCSASGVSGSYSQVGAPNSYTWGGIFNRNYAQYGFQMGGQWNVLGESAQYAVQCGGQGVQIGCNSVGQDAGYASGNLAGRGIKNDAREAVTLGGRDLEADYNARYSVTHGFGVRNKLFGMRAFSSCYFSTPGDFQVYEGTCAVQASGTTGITLKLDFGAGNTLPVLPDNTTWGFLCDVIVRGTGGTTEYARYDIKGIINRGAGAATTALVAGTSSTAQESAGAAPWTCVHGANTTLGAFQLTLTLAAGMTANAGGRVILIQLKG